jgi:hypothetical protein
VNEKLDMVVNIVGIVVVVEEEEEEDEDIPDSKADYIAGMLGVAVVHMVDMGFEDIECIGHAFQLDNVDMETEKTEDWVQSKIQ